MKHLLFFLIMTMCISSIAKEKTVLLYELNNSKISTYGDKILSPYTYEIQEKSTKIQNYIELFKFLSLKKDTLYANTHIVDTPETQKKLLSTGIVTIKLDEASLKHFNEIASEVVYSLTENGAEGVVFENHPKHKEKVFTRLEIEYTSFVLLIPYFNVLPPNNLTTGFIKLENNDILMAKSFYKKIKKGDNKINKMIVNLVKNGTKSQKISAIKSLPYTSIKKVEKLLIPNLDNEDNDIVLASLDGLIGKKSTKLLTKLTELLEKNDNELIKLNSAKTLIASGNKSFMVSGLQYFLDSNNIQAKKEAILSISKHKKSESILIMMLDDKNPSIKITALEHLKTAKKDKSFEKFKSLLADQDENVALIASNILLTNKKYRKYGLYHQLKTKNKKLSLQAAMELKKQKTPETITNLIACIEKCSEHATAFESAKTLLSFKEKGAILPFFLRLEQVEIQPYQTMIQEFLALLSSKEQLEILEKNASKILSQEIIKRLALQNKGSKNEKMVQLLANFLKSKHLETRNEAIKALHALSGDKALELALTISNDPSSLVRDNLLNMASDYQKDQVSELLLKYLEDTEDSIRIKAMHLITKFKIQEAIPLLEQYTTSSIKKVKLKALETLVKVSDKIERDMEEKFQTLLDQDDEEVRVWAIYALAKTYKKPNLPFITPYGSSDLPAVRQAVIYAVGELDDENNTKIEMAYGALEDDSLDVKYEAAKAIEKIGQKKDVERLSKLLPQIKNEKVKILLKRGLNTIKNRTSED